MPGHENAINTALPLHHIKCTTILSARSILKTAIDEKLNQGWSTEKIYVNLTKS